MKSIREKFVNDFGEEFASKLECAADCHANGINSENKGSDPFKWVLLICIGYQCFEIKEYREYHGLPNIPTYATLKKWIRNNADLGTHDGDCDNLSLVAGVYTPFVKSSKKTK
jgi:hypothetical protein